MKNIFCVLLFVSIFISNSCSAQQIVEKPSDAKKLEVSEKKFFGHPLKILLNTIKPQIKRVLISPGGGETNSFFVFYFVDDQEYSNLRKENKIPVSIRVYTKEKINWNASDKPKSQWWTWNENDVKKYENLTIKAIRVSGESY